MARGRKPFNSNSVNTWEDIFWKNIPTFKYMTKSKTDCFPND
jgi:hypothetical protein